MTLVTSAVRYSKITGIECGLQNKRLADQSSVFKFNKAGEELDLYMLLLNG